MSDKSEMNRYNPYGFEKPSFAIDVLIFSLSNEDLGNYRKLDKKHFSVLLIKRDDEPFKNQWCLPGGFVDIKESIEESVERILLRETKLNNVYVEQLYTFGGVDRDPRTRVISTAYMALVNKDNLQNPVSGNAEWFDMEVIENKDTINCKLTNGKENIEFTAKISGNNHEIVKNKGMGFDHPLFIITGLMRLRNKVEYTDIAFNVMPDLFTLTELQNVYETILGKKLLAPAFRRIIAKKVVKTNNMRIGAGHRPAVLFKYKK